MKVAVLLGSQRNNGTSSEIEKIILRHTKHTYDFIRMSESNITACLACEKCGITGKCVLSNKNNDMFENILYRIISSDIFLVITPIYSPYPSRLTAFMERLLSISFFGYTYNKIERPLKGKKTGIICYGSNKIEDETQLKMLFQKYLMDNYSFTNIDYDYLNNEPNPNEKYPNVINYVEAVIQTL